MSQLKAHAVQRGRCRLPQNTKPNFAKTCNNTESAVMVRAASSPTPRLSCQHSWLSQRKKNKEGKQVRIANLSLQRNFVFMEQTVPSGMSIAISIKSTDTIMLQSFSQSNICSRETKLELNCRNKVIQALGDSKFFRTSKHKERGTSLESQFSVHLRA